MKVSELAKSLKSTDEAVLAVLKSLKLKAKDGEQELSSVVVSVVKSHFNKSNKALRPEKEKSSQSLKEKKTTKVVKAKKEEKKDDKKIEKKVVKKETKTEKEVKLKKSDKKDIEKVEKVEKIEKVERFEKKEVVKPIEKPIVKEVKEIKVEKELPKKEVPVIQPKAPIVQPSAYVKPKIKLSKEPLITLKPLPKKKKRIFPESGEQATATSTQDASATVTGAVSSTQSVEVPKRYDQLVDLEIQTPITVKDFSLKIQQKPSVVLKELMNMGVFAHINLSLEGEIIQRLASAFGFNAVKIKTQEEQVWQTHKEEEEDPSLLQARAPVVTFMGHVDHGKTSLLDRIRKAKVADSEHGGITQHIGAYSVKLPKGRITFLDTPGHEAFTAMRARGAHITDIVVLVVAADEGIMPQTDEAIDHARAANVPIVVAINKIDRPGANLDKVKKQLSERDLMTEDWGGKTVAVGVSAVTGAGIDTLLEMILLEAELMELRANPNKKASGIVVEAHLSRGKGSLATLIVQSGTLKEGNIVIVGPFYGKAKAMFDDHKRSVKEAGPSVPVEILGLSDVPEAGEKFYVVEDERTAREITLKRQEQLKNEKLQARQRITLEGLFSQIEQGVVKELNVLIKADVQGSLEAIKDSLQKIPSDKVKLRLIHTGIGDINTSDILLAYVSKAIIIAFHVAVDPQAKQELEKQPVDIREYRIIYDVVDDMKKALEGLLDAKLQKRFLGRVEIREVFKLTKGVIAGCYVNKGRLHRKVNVDLIRDSKIIFSGNLSSLKRFKDDVREVNEGMECGLMIANFNEYQPGDIVEAYEIDKIAQRL